MDIVALLCKGRSMLQSFTIFWPLDLSVLYFVRLTPGVNVVMFSYCRENLSLSHISNKSLRAFQIALWDVVILFGATIVPTEIHLRQNNEKQIAVICTDNQSKHLTQNQKCGCPTHRKRNHCNLFKAQYWSYCDEYDNQLIFWNYAFRGKLSIKTSEKNPLLNESIIPATWFWSIFFISLVLWYFQTLYELIVCERLSLCNSTKFS